MARVGVISGYDLLPVEVKEVYPLLPTEESDRAIRFVIDNMRPEDRREIRKIGGNDPEWEVLSSFRMSDICMVAYSDSGDVLSIFGGRCLNLINREIQVWSLSTTPCESHWVEFARESKGVLKVLMDAFPYGKTFTNYIDLDYTRAVRWVKWMGAELSETLRVDTPYGGHFAKFIFRREG